MRSAWLFLLMAVMFCLVGSVRAEQISNGGFESPVGNALTPDGWTKDFNCFGTFSGAAYSGLQGVHPGGGSASGGLYQDMATTAGETYTVSMMVQNFGSAAGGSNVRVLVGEAQAITSVAVDDQGAGTTAFDPSGLLVDTLVGTDATGAWSQGTASFTATSTTTRLGVYNAYMSGQSVHSINIDDITLIDSGLTDAILNGDFESPVGNGLNPDSWTKDFNCYGTFSGAAYSGVQGVHPGGGAASGGLFQDVTTVVGETYDLSLFLQNFAGDMGDSTARLLVGDASSWITTAVDDQGAGTVAFGTLIADELHATDATGAWSEVAFSFTATGSSTRLGVYNSNMSGLDVHSINIDDVSVVPEPATLALLGLGGLVLRKRRV